MTSNIGSQFLLEGVTESGEIKPAAREAVLRDMRQHFRPEFLNRVDEVVLFKPLTLPEIEKIVDLLGADLRRRLADREMTLEMTPRAREYIARRGYDPVYGARPLRRYLQSEVETRIARALIAGQALPGAAIQIDVADSQLQVEIENPSTVDSNK
jgi:ATP-dependent Clp protease ATP-binding subunit ClpB